MGHGEAHFGVQQFPEDANANSWFIPENVLEFVCLVFLRSNICNVPLNPYVEGGLRGKIPIK